MFNRVCIVFKSVLVLLFVMTRQFSLIRFDFILVISGRISVHYSLYISMGGKSSKRSAPSRYSSFGSSSNPWSHHEYPQSSYPQQTQTYGPTPPPLPQSYGGFAHDSKKKLERKYSRIDDKRVYNFCFYTYITAYNFCFQSYSLTHLYRIFMKNLKNNKL